MSVSSPFLHLLLPFCSFFSLLIIFPFSLLGETRVGSFPPPWGRVRERALGASGRGLLIYFFLLSFISLSYSFLVMRMNEPCWGAVTPSMSTGSWKLRRWLSALQMR